MLSYSPLQRHSSEYQSSEGWLVPREVIIGDMIGKIHLEQDIFEHGTRQSSLRECANTKLESVSFD